MKSAVEVVQTKDIEELKRQWKNDPCWDIYDTAGFEAHRDELFAFQKQQELIWEVERQRNLLQQCELWGCSPRLVEYLNKLENRVQQLEASQV